MSPISFIIIAIMFAVPGTAYQGPFGHQDNCNVTCTKGNVATVCATQTSTTCESVSVQPICVIVKTGNESLAPANETGPGGESERHRGGHRGPPPTTVNSTCEFCRTYTNTNAVIISCCECHKRREYFRHDYGNPGKGGHRQGGTYGGLNNSTDQSGDQVNGHKPGNNQGGQVEGVSHPGYFNGGNGHGGPNPGQNRSENGYNSQDPGNKGPPGYTKSGNTYK